MSRDDAARTAAERHVSDHAVLRWIERYGFVDVAAIRRQIYAETRHALHSGASRVLINGTDYRIRDGKVTTIILGRDKARPLAWKDRP